MANNTRKYENTEIGIKKHRRKFISKTWVAPLVLSIDLSAHAQISPASDTAPTSPTTSPQPTPMPEPTPAPEPTPMPEPTPAP